MGASFFVGYFKLLYDLRGENEDKLSERRYNLLNADINS